MSAIPVRQPTRSEILESAAIRLRDTALKHRASSPEVMTVLKRYESILEDERLSRENTRTMMLPTTPPRSR